MSIKTKPKTDPDYVSMLQDLPFGMLVVDFQGKIVQVNKMATEVFDFGSAKPEGKKLKQWLKDNSRPPFDKFLERVNHPSPGSSGLNESFRILDQAGSEFLLTLAYQPSYESDNSNLVGVLTTVSDPRLMASEKKAINQQEKISNLEHELEQEAELSDMKSRFLSIASHEFRTPLAGITSSLQLIRRYIQADLQAWNRFRHHEKVDNHLSKIGESAKNLTTILNRFLSLRVIERGEIPVRLIMLDPAKILEKLVAQFQPMGKKGQQFHYQHEGVRESILLDRTIFKNIFNNLLSNASKFSAEDGKIEVRSFIDEKQFIVEVADQGIGIPEGEQSKIFRRFFRAENALVYSEGTGLGLHIVRKYVELMDGEIHFTSRENEGSTFSVSFPMRKS
ncbi:MAG: PAS domain-containing sensor histidine kinase [bacterium]